MKNGLSSQIIQYTEEAERLKSAYQILERQFYELKERLEASHQTLEQIITHMTEGLIFIEKQGSIVLVNPAASQMLGIPREQLMMDHYSNHFDDFLFGFSIREMLERFSSHRRLFITLREEVDIEVSTSAIPEKGILLLLCDRTEQRILEKSLSQVERLKDLGQMAATLAHEIRNPLGGIEGFANLLKRDLESPNHVGMVTAILNGTQILNRLVTEVLDYARPLQLHFSPVDLVKLIEETIDLAAASSRMPTCQFSHALSTYIRSIDREKIQLVLLNLLKNAAEAKATTIGINLTADGMIYIKDNGIGIEEKNLKKIFTPFFTTKARGTGLGLAHALAIIKAHDGALEVQSENQKGTQITLKIYS